MKYNTFGLITLMYFEVISSHKLVHKDTKS